MEFELITILGKKCHNELLDLIGSREINDAFTHTHLFRKPSDFWKLLLICVLWSLIAFWLVSEISVRTMGGFGGYGMWFCLPDQFHLSYEFLLASERMWLIYMVRNASMRCTYELLSKCDNGMCTIDGLGNHLKFIERILRSLQNFKRS